ncbi:MAG: outer membrane lipoprotein carrier protein LolA [Saprospiraceae bacterium]
MLRKLAFFLVIVVAMSSSPLVAQDYTKSADSDPEARKILNAVRQKYETYTSIEATFSLDIELPEQPKETQQGTMARYGDKYHLSFGGQEVFSDGAALYLVLHNNKSVQINHLPEPGESDLLSPESIFQFYDNGQFIYSLIDTQTENGKVVHIIEFKPTDRYSEYAKLRMIVNRDTKEVVRVKAFAKDGSRYTFQIKQMTPNKHFAADFFSFNKAKFPGYYVEDLR